MALNNSHATVDRKNLMRRMAYDARNAQPYKDEFSKTICDKFVRLPEYVAAKTAMWYLDVRSEVRTQLHLRDALQSNKRIVIPYCFGEMLRLWRLENMDELVQGAWKILEPPIERWNETEKHVQACDLDIVMVPGVAFDRRGGRIGNGMGYYDKLLAAVRNDTVLAAAAFESQLFDDIPFGPQDVFMDKIITERAVYEGGGEKLLVSDLV